MYRARVARWVSKSGPRTSRVSITWELRNAGSWSPDPVNQELWGWSPRSVSEQAPQGVLMHSQVWEPLSNEIFYAQTIEGCKALCQHGILKAFCEKLSRNLFVGFFFQLIFYLLQLQIQNTVFP